MNDLKVSQGKTSEFSLSMCSTNNVLYQHTTRAPDEDPLRHCSFGMDTSAPIVISSWRPDRPRDIWAYSISEGYSLEKAMGTRRFWIGWVLPWTSVNLITERAL